MDLLSVCVKWTKTTITNTKICAQKNKYGLPEFMDFDYLRKTTAANLASLTNLALAPEHQKK
jgi:hypothetical protein